MGDIGIEFDEFAVFENTFQEFVATDYMHNRDTQLPSFDAKKHSKHTSGPSRKEKNLCGGAASQGLKRSLAKPDPGKTEGSLSGKDVGSAHSWSGDERRASSPKQPKTRAQRTTHADTAIEVDDLVAELEDQQVAPEDTSNHS